MRKLFAALALLAASTVLAADLPIRAPLTPSSTAFPIAHGCEVAGGLCEVADVPTRDALPTSRLVVGELVYVQSNSTLYQLTALGPAAWSVFGSFTGVTADSPLSGLGTSASHLICPTCVVTSGSYADPAWLTSLAGSKITGQVAIANGGTNLASVGGVANRVLLTTDGSTWAAGTAPNAALANSSVTVNTSGPLSGGGSLSLGGTLTLSCPTCVTTARLISTSTCLLGGGDLSADRTLSVDQACAPTWTGQHTWTGHDLWAAISHGLDTNAAGTLNLGSTNATRVAAGSSSAPVSVVGGLALHSGTVSSTGTTTLTANDLYTFVNAAGTPTIKLPASPSSQELHHIDDVSGAAANGNTITLDGNGNTINGASTRTIARNFGRLSVLWDTTGSQWRIVERDAYEIIQSNGAAQTARKNLNFSTSFALSDSAANDRTTADIASGGVANAQLANSSITVNTTAPITGGATPSLGGSLTLACATCITGTPAAIGDLHYSTAGGQAQTMLPDVAAGSYLRSGGVAAAPLWSTLTLPNAATQGDILYATGANAVGRLADVAVNQVLLSGGVGANPGYGTVPNAGLTNSSITIAGTAGQINVSGGSPVALGGTATASLPSVGPGAGTYAGGPGLSIGLDGQGRVNALTPGSVSGGESLYCPGAQGGVLTSHAHVSHGHFWQQSSNLGSFFWEGWVQPISLTGSSFIVSDGKGGAHAVLLGMTNVAPGQMNTLTGNVYTGVSSTSVTADNLDGCWPGEWCHVAMGWDGLSSGSKGLILWTDGVVVGSTPFLGPRQSPTTNAGGGGHLLIAGSDHNTWEGYIQAIRGFEGTMPLAVANQAFAPQRNITNSAYFSPDTFVPAVFIADYTTPQRVIGDESNIGYGGVGKIAAPVAPGISNQGSAGLKSYTYKVVALLGALTTDAGASINTATGNTTLDNTNFNRLTITAIPRATSYQVFRTATTGTPATTGLIGTVPAGTLTFDDTGLAGDSTVPSQVNTTAGGQLHSGVLEASTVTNGFAGGPLTISSNTVTPLCNWVMDTTAPLYVTGANDPTLPAERTYTPVTAPVSVKIFDSFERRNQTFAFNRTPALGSTESGSLGALAWTEGGVGPVSDTAGHLGIFNGRMVWLDQFRDVAWVSNNSADMDVRVKRTIYSNNVASTGIAFRVTDKDNFLLAYPFNASNASTIRVVQIVGGVQQFLDGQGAFTQYTAPANNTWTELRVVTSGTTLTVYTGVPSGSFDANAYPLFTWTQAGQFVGETTQQAATGVGVVSWDASVANLTGQWRADEFQVY